jgi:hypothetical protein
MTTTFYVTLDAVDQFEAAITSEVGSIPRYRGAVSKGVALRVYEAKVSRNFLIIAKLAGWLDP